MSLFYNDRVFGSRGELMDWVQTTARNLGYVIVTQRTKKNVLGFVKKVYIMCDRGGEYKSVSQSTTHSGTKKRGCPFQLIAKYNHDLTRSGWKINVICDEHNHDPAIFLEAHAFAKRLSKKEFEIVEDMTKKNMAPREILTQLKKNDDQNVSTRQTVYDARKKIHKAERVGQTPMQSMVKYLHTGDYVYHIREEPDSNQVQDLFFINPISMMMWRAFPHVLILDHTYKTNRYHLPFLQIVGLTSTNKTFCIAFAFIRNEKIGNIKWVLHCLRQTLDGYMLPRVIVTDRDFALMEACRYVFPEASCLLCRYHIYENIRKNHRPSFGSQKDWDKFTSWWNRVINSPTIDNYVQNRTWLHSKLIDKQNVFRYLDENWLEKYKEKFVSAWIDQHLNFGERTTNRVESQHSLLKIHLENERSRLDKFVGIIDDIVRIQYTEIKASFGESMNKIKHLHRNRTFNLLLTKVSIEALDVLTKEMKRVKSLKEKEESCGCQIRTSCGLPCACVIYQYVDADVSIPLKMINVFWKKLDFEPALLNRYEPDDPAPDVREHTHAFEEAYNKEERTVVKKSWLQKMRAIWDPSSTSYAEPAVQTKTRGRPSTKPKHLKKSDLATVKPPLQRSYSHKPPRHSSYAPSVERDDVQELTRHSSFRYSQYQEHPTPCSLRDYDNEPTRHSSYVDIDLNNEPARHSSYVDIDLNNEPARHSSYVDIDLNNEPARHSSYVDIDLNNEPASHSSLTQDLNESFYPEWKQSPTRLPFLDQIPKVFHDYVERIVNVKPDGNCGYRALAVALGFKEHKKYEWAREQMVAEYEANEEFYEDIFAARDHIGESLRISAAPRDERDWMPLMEGGILISNRFGLIVHCICMAGSTTVFSFWISQESALPHQVISIALTGGNHYMMVKLKDNYPMPPITPYWNSHREDQASGWEYRYRDRLHHYSQLTYKPPVYLDITSPGNS